tara:strand:+ start:5371 stop:5802 length:432 start_codon:yes stop_codon:yes gene_type:complete
MNSKELVTKLKSKDYYTKLLNNLIINGLYDIAPDKSVNYINLVLNLLDFLKKNKKYIKNFKSKDFENIIILCVDEILTNKLNIELDEEELRNIILLVKDSYLIKNLITYFKDLYLKLYYKYRCNFCFNQNDLEIVDVGKADKI